MLYLPVSYHNALLAEERRERLEMPDSEQSLVTYLDLACASRRRRRLSESDKLLVLAAVAGSQLGWPEVAEACRRQVLTHNPRHLVRRWPTIEAALQTERFQLYLKHVGRQYSPEKAEYMLACLGQRPIFKGSSAREMAHSLLAKIATACRRSRDRRWQDIGSARRRTRRPTAAIGRVRAADTTIGR